MFEYMKDFYIKKFRKIANSIWEDEHKIDTPDISGEETNINEKIEYWIKYISDMVIKIGLDFSLSRFFVYIILI